MAANLWATFSNFVFMHEHWCILIPFSLKFVASGPMKNKPAMAQVMSCR